MFKKEEIRQNIKKIFESVNFDILKEKNIQIKNKILENHMVKKSKTIWFFIWWKLEPETKGIIETLLNDWKQVFLPKIVNNDEMIFSEINSINDLKIWKFGILEPKSDDFFDKIEVFLVPGVAFTKNWKRIWKWKWYYDKYFSKNNENYKIWICYDFQVLDDFEINNFDITMNEIIF